MKTKTIILIFVGLCLALGLSASEPYTILKHSSKTVSSNVREHVYMDNRSSTPVYKYIYEYSLSGDVLNKARYNWKIGEGWVGHTMFEYTLSTIDSTQITSMKVIQWDTRKKKWSDNDKTTIVCNNM